MVFPEELEKRREQYPAGTRIKLVSMQDKQAPPSGTLGTVNGVDDAGDLMMSWDNGSSLKIIIGEDTFVKV